MCRESPIALAQLKAVLPKVRGGCQATFPGTSRLKMLDFSPFIGKRQDLLDASEQLLHKGNRREGKGGRGEERRVKGHWVWL